MMKKRLTATQRQWLIDLAEGKNPWDKIHGMSAHGGGTCTQFSLVRAGMVEWNDSADRHVITLAGRQAVGVGLTT